MAMILSENQKSDYKPIDEGTYVAVCCHLIDIGDHYSEQYDKSQHKCLVNFELFDAGRRPVCAGGYFGNIAG